MKSDDFSSRMAGRSQFWGGMAIRGASARSLKTDRGFQPAARAALGARE
jgi:hypothetical protein